VGRPRVRREIRHLSVRMARDVSNHVKVPPGLSADKWGAHHVIIDTGEIHIGLSPDPGRVEKLGHRVARSTIAIILRTHGIGAVPKRPMSWRTFLAAHWGAIAAADFFTTEECGPCAAWSPTTRRS
jgi:hypothetical protein